MADNIKYRFIQNVGDYFPSGYFNEDFIDKVQKAAGRSADEMSELCRPYVRLRQDYEAYKNYIINTNPRVKDAIKHTHDFHTKLLDILGYPTEGAYQQFISVNDEYDAVVPVRHVLTHGGKTSMLVMEMQHLIKTDDREPAGLFEQRYNVEAPGRTETVSKHQQYYASQWSEVFTLPSDVRISPKVINKAIDAIFLLPQERRPHYILMMAGNNIFLLDSEKWNRGAYLQFSLDELYSQASFSAKYRVYYALFHLLVCKETLAAESETVLMDRLVEESYKSAYEVTKDLKEGVVHAVETLANEALYWWTQHDSIPVDDYTDDDFEAKVKDDCLTIVYRLLFIFYAESRDELGILPMNDEVYMGGYSLEMLRDLENVPLISQSARDGYFIHESLWRLFRLMSSGYKENQAHSDKSFTVRHIDSPLFNDKNMNYLADVKFRNAAWQDIIRSLSLSHSERQVGRISYANLGINQLGSVYESLLAYRGFYAEEDYIEVHKAGSPQDGTYLVPYSRMDDFRPDEILQDGDGHPVILKRGTFVYRLNGRDRQKSASYYTPEILTRSTVKYTIKAILDEVSAGKRKATDLLDLKILEPAMGAAAFQNEVINQLAEAYLQYRQQEKKAEGVSSWHIAPDKYRDELQKVKAYIATHNVYGVDLNPTAIELGKLSLWLNVIHKDMETPFFSNRLAVGNAVIGAWLKVYSKNEVVATPGKGNKLIATKWWEKAPHKVSFRKNGVNRSVNEVYHFLLPDNAMLGVRNSEQKKAYLDADRHMKNIIKDWTAPLSGMEFTRLQRISAKIDVLLKEYFQFQKSVEDLTQNKVNLWGVPGVPIIKIDTYEEKERLNEVRYRHDNAYYRLKMVMDYWCALWFWEYGDAADLPTRTDYWNDIEAMLNVSDEELDTRTARALRRVPVDEKGQPTLFPQPTVGNLFDQPQHVNEPQGESYGTRQTEEEAELVRLSKEDILTEVKGEYRSIFDDSQRFKIVAKLSNRYHFFHPMLEFIEVFWLRDGFDIICGNPPWIKLEFDIHGVISEKYPEVKIRKMTVPQVRVMSQKLFEENPSLEEAHMTEEIEHEGQATFMNAYSNYPLLVGQANNLYKCILENGFSMLNSNGYMGLLHPETVYDDPKGQPLRKEIYKRLRYHFQFANEMTLFAEVDHHTKYGENIYGSKRNNIDFQSIHNLFHPGTIDNCFIHDGTGLCGGIKKNGKWNTEAHHDRIIHFSSAELKVLSDAFEDGADWQSVKLTSIHTKNIINVLKAFSLFKSHVSDYGAIVSEGLHETIAVEKGIMERRTAFPDFVNCEMIYSGPHFFVGNPVYKCPRKECVLNSDYDVIDLMKISDDYLPRTNYVPSIKVTDFRSYITGFFKGQDVNGADIYDNWIDYYRIGFRRQIGSGSERSLSGGILSKNCSHIGGVTSVTFNDYSVLLEFCALTCSLAMDFYVKAIDVSDVRTNRISKFPLGVDNKYKTALFSRTLILNCLTKYYVDLWVEMWQEEYKQEKWSIEDDRLKPFSSFTEQWQWSTPLRNHFERRQALVEIDVIAAMALGLSLQDLETIYIIQFPVLQQNENDTWYDAEGKIVFTCSRGLTGVGLTRPQWNEMRGELSEDGMTYAGTSPTYTHTIDPARSELYGGQQQTFVAPYTRCDRIADYRRAWAHFDKIFNS